MPDVQNMIQNIKHIQKLFFMFYKLFYKKIKKMSYYYFLCQSLQGY